MAVAVAGAVAVTVAGEGAGAVEGRGGGEGGRRECLLELRGRVTSTAEKRSGAETHRDGGGERESLERWTEGGREE